MTGLLPKKGPRMLKKQRIALASGLSLLILLSSCGTHLLPAPVNAGAGGGLLAAPEELDASQGKRRVITLSWKEVAGAVRYIVYRSASPLEEFMPCAETADAAAVCDIAVPPGADLYFRVAALNNRDEVSPKSLWVRGTSMARPEISDVVPDPASPDTARVYWYMNNAEPSTYKGYLRYTVYCFEGELEKDHIPVDGSVPGDTSVTIGGLVPGPDYSFQVEAYLEGDPGITETSVLWKSR